MAHATSPTTATTAPTTIAMSARETVWGRNGLRPMAVQYLSGQQISGATLRAVRRILRPRSVVLFALLLAPFVACGGDDAPEGSGGEAGSSGEVDGQAIYESRCAACHGRDGGGGTGPALGDGEVEANLTLDEQISVITNGRNGMPSWEGELSEDEIEAVAVYEREELGR